MCGGWFMLGHRWCPGWRSWLLGLLSPAGHKKGAAVTAAPVGRTLKEAGELHRLGSLCAAVDFRPRRPRGQARAFRSRGACRGIPGSSPSISVMISPARQSRCHSRAFLPGGVGHRFVSFRVDGAVCSHHEGTPATGRRGGSRSGAQAKGPGHVLPGVYQLGSGAGWRINRRGPTRRPVVGRPCPTREDDAVNRKTGGVAPQGSWTVV